jgi:hypothetical protein
MSHLSTLIERVKGIENDGCDEIDLMEKLINLAEYLTFSFDFTEWEAKEAIGILEKYNMDGLIGNTDGISGFHQKLHNMRRRQTLAVNNALRVVSG